MSSGGLLVRPDSFWDHVEDAMAMWFEKKFVCGRRWLHDHVAGKNKIMWKTVATNRSLWARKQLKVRWGDFDSGPVLSF